MIETEQPDICCVCGGSTAEAMFRLICDECRKTYTEVQHGDDGDN